MLFQTLSISSILLGIYLILAFFRNNQIDIPFQYESDFHIGCYNGNINQHQSNQIRSFIDSIQINNQQINIQLISSSIASKIDFNKQAKQVARNFQKFLNQYYKIKTKSDLQDDYFNSLQIAKSQFINCQQQTTDNQLFNSQACLQYWGQFTQSKSQYQAIKLQLTQKIKQKKQKQEKISSLFFNNDFQDEEQLQKKYSSRIKELDSQKLTLDSQLQTKKFAKTQNLQKLKLNSDTLNQISQKLQDCQKNKKIITFCIDLVEDLKVISLNVTKEDMQKRIHRKRQIIEAYQNAIKKAYKFNDESLVKYNAKQLQKNKAQLELLELRINGLSLSEDKYCTECSEQKIVILRQQILALQKLVLQYKSTIETMTVRISQLEQRIEATKKQKQKLQGQIQFSINSKVCLSQECKDQRQKNISSYRNQLNSLKYEVLNKKDRLNSHRSSHETKISRLRSYIQTLSRLNQCIRKKQYYQKLKTLSPKHLQNQLIHIGEIKKNILKQLSHFEVSKKQNIRQLLEKQEL